ncbi:Phenylpyruvate tautomerase PptA, 4-oxalocrotonate tautomerase family [Devosia lucknowensis]|uniref:Phenylpyruvate tautomerase PptA, 4-oxalocrotonate tautomerase family n=1 Tax=Devosia lucknowensis TaxID=1096929 RepID=A0A1Y6EVW2_9HYPH|nr:tautomerase family protein [Devosia lucknowensis]SMQ65381.1 Phenylpyruvate tautomerase PptA, 4-oxalocrotonate tautomerase family [Devosia lucknowensis]
MPSTRIETRSGWLGARRGEFIEAVQAALVEGILIPAQDRCVRLHEFELDAVISPATSSERYTVIEISLFTGRSIEAKRRLYAAMVTRLAAFGLEPHDIKVILHEVPRENWGLRGKPASEIELGFKVDV